MGWPVPQEERRISDDLEWYINAATREYPDNTAWHSVWTFAEDVQLHDLVWFRDLNGRFYLAEVTGPWQYDYEDEELRRADIVNFRPVRIIEVGLADAVPGKIIACFRPSRTFQAIRSPGMLAFSEKLAGMPATEVPPNLFEFMSDVDLENLVMVYLQYLGWYVLPGTRTTTTAHYECILVNQKSGDRAIVQVKSGNTPIDASQYAGNEMAFLFAASGNYGAEIPSNAVIVTNNDLTNFMQNAPHLLPRAVSTWLAIAGLPIV
jgi:hypothetical protein